MVKCPHCGSGGLNIQEVSPSGSQFKFIAIKCSSCSAIAGLVDYFNIGAMLNDQKRELAQIKGQLGDIQSALIRLEQRR